MDFSEEIILAFPEILNTLEVTDDFIEGNANLMEIEGDINHFIYVPSYMLWCLRKKDTALVDTYTVNALAEFGRTKMQNNTYLNFMYRCNPLQKRITVKFLQWCFDEISTANFTQIERAIKNWSKESD